MLFRCSYKVSIPHGTIKRTIKRKIDNLINAFQFHMVRLKVDVSYKISDNQGEVSIPHGTIKRGRSTFAFHKFARVSIPHGTIKSVLQLCTTSMRLLFQFHMVRLKVRRGYFQERQRRRFQFHMVRLKDVLRHSSTRCWASFNSTWYD